MNKKLLDTLFENFIDDFLSLPVDLRTDMIKIAERYYEGQVFSTEEIYAYIFWRTYELEVSDFLSWAGVFKEYNLYKPRQYINK